MKTMEEIYQELAGEFQSRTGLTAGGNGDLAVRFYAVASQLYGLYVQADWTRRQCFPQTAEGEYLERHAQMRGLDRHQAVKATGTVRFFGAEERTGSTEIPLGIVCMTAEGRRYVTTQAGTMGAEDTQLDLAVEAVEPGAASNVAAGRIVYLAVAPAGVIACTNPNPLVDGQDEEGDEVLRKRVLATYSRLANGANTAFYEQAAMSFDGVAAVKVLPRNRGVGTVDVLVTATGGMPGDALLGSVQDYFDEIREIAVDVQVSAPTAQSVDVAVTLTAGSAYTFDAVSQSVEQAVEGWFTGSRLGCPVLQAELTALVFGVPGVANCAVTVTGGDVAGVATVLPRLGTLTVTQA